MRLGNKKCAGAVGPISLEANTSSRTASHASAGGVSGNMKGSTAIRADNFDGQDRVRLFELDPGQAVAEEIPAFAPVHRFRVDLQRRQSAPAGRAD